MAWELCFHRYAGVEMINFKLLELSDRAVLQPFVSVQGRWIADTSFTNMFMWRHAREISFALLQGHCVIQTRYPNANPFIFYPLGKGDKKPIIEALIAYYKTLNLPLEFHSLTQEECDELARDFPGQFEIEKQRDRFDYIYNTQELISLTGRKFHKKKNHLNRFYLQYPQTKFETISSTNIDEVIAVNNLWYSNANKDDKGLYFENLGINDSLTYFDELSLQGGILRIDNEIAAFSFGEELDKDCALIHIEKANIIFNGAYQAINQALLKHTFSHTQYANREEDLGIEGLRKAKLSYQPAFLLEKSNARFKM